MSKAAEVTAESSSVDSSGFSRDETLEILSNQRRRFVISYLKQHEDQDISVSDLAEYVASLENNKEIKELTSQERKRVRNALRQFHLPKMDDYEFIEFDSKRGTVSLTEGAANTNFYIDSLTGGDVPWGVYYLGLSAVSIACLIGISMQMLPFTLFSPEGWGVFFVTALGVSSIAHFYDNYYRMRLGASDESPEIKRS